QMESGYGWIRADDVDSNQPVESRSRLFCGPCARLTPVLVAFARFRPDPDPTAAPTQKRPQVAPPRTARLIPRDISVHSANVDLEWLSCSAECVRQCARSACPWRGKSPLTERCAGATSDVHRPPHAGMVGSATRRASPPGPPMIERPR